MAQNGSHPDSSARRGGWLDWIERHPKTVGAVCVFVALAGVWVALDAAGQARLRRAMTAVREKGEPLALDDLRTHMPVVPDAQNMALGILEHGGAIHRLTDTAEFREQSAKLPILGYPKGIEIGAHFPDEQLAAARAFLAANSREISAVEAATLLKEGSYPIAFNSPGNQILLPHLSIHRTASKSLALKALVDAADGKAPEATRALTEMAAMDVAIRSDPFLIGMLVRIACQSLTCNTMLRCLALTPFSDEQLNDLDDCMRPFALPPGLHDAMLAERVLSFDSVMWAYQGGNLGAVMGGRPTPGFLVRAVPALKGVDPAIYLEQMARLCDAAKLPAAKAIAEAGAIEQGSKDLPFYALSSKIMIPSLSRAFTLWFRGAAIIQSTRIALACERFRLKHGEWPGDVRQLVPQFLPESAIDDPFSGKPFVYHRDADGIRVYSVGEDGVDDGGIFDRERARAGRTAFDPGVYLPNPDRRNLAAVDASSPATP